MGPRIKVCGVTSPAEARRCVELGADYVGVIVYADSPRHVPKERIPDILAEIPGGRRVMVDVNTATDELERYGDLGFDFFQIHFDLDAPLASLAGWSGIVGSDSLWLAPRIPPNEPFPQVILSFADTIVLDSYSPKAFGGTGEVGGWQRFSDWKTLYQHKRFVLAGGLAPENITAALQATGADLIDVNSGVELSPGRKDFARLERLMTLVRNIYAEQPHLWD